MDKREKKIIGIFCCLLLFAGANLIMPRLLSTTYTVWLYPSLWLALCFFILFQPRVRFASKLILRPFLLLWVFLTAVVYIITYFASGFAFGMSRTPFSQMPLAIVKNLLAFVAVPVMMEWVRNYAINGALKKHQILFSILISILYAMLTLNLSKVTTILTWEDLVTFVGGDVLPVFVLNIFLCYVVYLGGASMGMIYQAVTIAPIYVLPVLPNMTWLAQGIIGTVFPLFSLYVLRDVYMKRTGQVKQRDAKKENPFGWIAVLAVSMAIVWFIAGLFPVYPVTIMSGSMEPLVYPGDVVVIERTSADEIKIGDIVQYWSNEFFIIHRVIDIDVVDDATVYITKGDNNNVRDLKPVKAAQIRGKVVATVPKLGYLTYLIRAH